MILDEVAPRDGGLLVPALLPRLAEEARWLEGTGFAAGPRRTLVGWLARCWIALGQYAMADTLPAGPTPELWERALATMPVLARLCERARDEWRRQVALLEARAPGAIAEVELLAGGNRVLPPSAILVVLETGRRVVYKPRDVRIGAWFLELCKQLNDVGLPAALHERSLVAHVDHCWDEFVQPAPCDRDDEKARYFLRVGELLRLFHWLRATDMHRRNVILAGEHPVIIDFDGLLRPVTPEHTWLQRTPYATGFLPMWLPGEAGRPALSAGGIQYTKGGTFPIRRPELTEDGTRFVAVYKEETSPLTAPASPYAYRDQILAGHDAMEAVLGRVDLGAHLARAAELPVLFFPRPIAVHKIALMQSLLPPRLASEATRDAYLAGVLDGPTGAAEIAALRDGFDPQFASLPGSDALVFPDGTQRAGAFAARALDRLHPCDPAREHEVIVTALALGEGDIAPPAITAAPRELDWRAAAFAIADLVCDVPLDAGVVWVPSAGVRLLGGLPADLLSGTAGMALALARISEESGSARHRDAAARALAHVARAVEAEKQPRWYGAHLGLAGQLFALEVAGKILGDAAAVDLAARRATNLRLEAVSIPTDDLVSGLAGLVALFPESWLGDLLLERRRVGLRPPPFPGGGLPALAPSLDEGVVWALRRIAAHTRDARYALGDPRPFTRASTPLEALELAPTVEHAAVIAGRHAVTGSWVAESRVADRLNPSALTGLLAVAYGFLRVTTNLPSLWQLGR